MKQLLSIAAVFICLQNLAFARSLSPEAEISVITCAPGNLIYECFGHTAIRIFDPLNNIDEVYNYGIFEFNKPNFELNFARGNLEYKLGVSPYYAFLPVYLADNRTITEQVLNLNEADKKAVYDFLQWNAQPQNRYYAYDYFYDNCATRVMQVIGNNIDGKVIYHTHFKDSLGYSIRNLVDIYSQNNTWSKLGIDLCLGAKIDHKIADSTYCFLPDYLEKSLAKATINGQPLVAETRIVHQGVPRINDVWWQQPIFVFWLLAIALLLHYVFGNSQTLKNIIDNSLYTVFGLFGLFMLSLWVLTDHKTAAMNLNLLWAMPLHLLLPFLSKNAKRTYLRIYSAILILLLVNWIWFPQQFNNALFPLLVVMAYRSMKKASAIAPSGSR
ncbi:DUF4105 domain-containing protein [bacterium]|nr:DUF4105 domain-containing protein [bacterium]